MYRYGHLARPVGAGVAERPARGDRRGRLGAVHLAVDPAIVLELLGDLRPGLLGNDQDAHAQLGHDARRLRRDRRRIGAAAEGLERRRPDVGARLPDELAVVLAIAALEALQQHPRRLDEARARLVHGQPEAVELDLARAAAEAQDEAAVGQGVEHRHFLGDAHRIVPGQHHHHRAERRAGGASRHVGEELQHVGAHRVVGEVVLDAPDGLKAERLGEIGEPELGHVDLAVRAHATRVLEDGGHAYLHARVLSRFDGVAVAADLPLVRPTLRRPREGVARAAEVIR